MTIAEILLMDFDAELRNTRRTLERIPDDKGDWKPHDKSMAMGRLAMHTALLPHFAEMILTTPSMDLADAKFPSFAWEGHARAVEALEESASSMKAKLAVASDEELQTLWKMSWGGKELANAPRAFLYRVSFFNHWIHHRAQLGVYLRLLNEKVPAIYGPSADEQ